MVDAAVFQNNLAYRKYVKVTVLDEDGNLVFVDGVLDGEEDHTGHDHE